MGRMISGRKVTEGAKVNMEVEHTESDPLLSFKNPSLIPVMLPSLMEFRIGLRKTHFTIDSSFAGRMS